MLMLIFNWI